MSQEYVYGSKGQVIGRLHKSGSTVNGKRIDVYNGFNNYVGYVDDSGTFNDTGFRISINRMPGLYSEMMTDNICKPSWVRDIIQVVSLLFLLSLSVIGSLSLPLTNIPTYQRSMELILADIPFGMPQT